VTADDLGALEEMRLRVRAGCRRMDNAQLWQAARLRREGMARIEALIRHGRVGASLLAERQRVLVEETEAEVRRRASSC
jgi:hypothetical protein